MCKFSGVEPSSAMKVNAWTCKCATSCFERYDFYGRALGCVLQDVVSAENQVDFSERHTIFVTEWSRAILKRHCAPSKFWKGRVQRQA